MNSRDILNMSILVRATGDIMQSRLNTKRSGKADHLIRRRKNCAALAIATVLLGTSLANAQSPAHMANPFATAPAGIDEARNVVKNPTASKQFDRFGVPVAVPGVLLSGASTDLAEQVLKDYLAPVTEADMAVAETAGSPARYYQKRIRAVIRDGATVEQVNAAIGAVKGRITVMWQGDKAVTIHVPDPGSLAGLEAIASQLEASGVFVAAHAIMLVQPDELPVNISPVEANIAADPTESPTTAGPIYHQTAVRGAAAWNVRTNAPTSATPVEIIVVDYFGRGNPQGVSADSITGVGSNGTCRNTAGSTVQVVPCTHGYHVLGIISGSFGGSSDPVGKTTGIFPRTAKIRAIDISVMPSTMDFETYFKQAMKVIVNSSPGSRFVLNMSIGSSCPSTTGNCLTSSAAEKGAISWRELVRSLATSFSYESRVLQVSSAGNRGNGTKAALNSNWNAAVLLGSLGGKSALSNGLVVESRVAQAGVAKAATPGPRAIYSTLGGNIGAIGTDVYSFFSPTTVGVASGTSMAAPQVAGLGAYILSASTGLSNADLITKLRTSRANADISEAPAIDAYAVLLSLDKSTSEAPIRQALLQPDVSNPAPVFTFANVMQFLMAYYPSAYGSAPVEQPDFSKYDLNGDGITGGAEKADFPMTPGSMVTEKLTDLEVLCKFVKTELYSATPEDKDQFSNEIDRLGKDYPEVITACGVAKTCQAVNRTVNRDNQSGLVDYGQSLTVDQVCCNGMGVNGNGSVTVTGSVTGPVQSHMPVGELGGYDGIWGVTNLAATCANWPNNDCTRQESDPATTPFTQTYTYSFSSNNYWWSVMVGLYAPVPVWYDPSRIAVLPIVRQQVGIDMCRPK